MKTARKSWLAVWVATFVTGLVEISSWMRRVVERSVSAIAAWLASAKSWVERLLESLARWAVTTALALTLVLVVLAGPALGQQSAAPGEDGFEAPDRASARREEMVALLAELRDDPVFADAIRSYEDLSSGLEKVPEQARALAEKTGRDWEVIALSLASGLYEELAARLMQSGRATAELQRKGERVVELFRELEAEDAQARSSLAEELERERAEQAALERAVKEKARAYLAHPSPAARAELAKLRQKLTAELAKLRLKTLFGPLEDRLSETLRQRRTDLEFMVASLEAVQGSFLSYAEGMRTTSETLSRMGEKLEMVSLTGADRLKLLRSPELGRLSEVSGLAVGRLEELIRAVEGVTDLDAKEDGPRSGDASLDAWIREQAGVEPEIPSPATERKPEPATVTEPKAAPEREPKAEPVTERKPEPKAELESETSKKELPETAGRLIEELLGGKR